MKKSPPKNKSETVPPPASQPAMSAEINQRAYELWEASGHQHGADTTHWLEAEREILSLRAPKSP